MNFQDFNLKIPDDVEQYQEARKCWYSALSGLLIERHGAKTREESFLIKWLLCSKVIWSWISGDSIFLYRACGIEKQSFSSLSLIPMIYEFHSLCLIAFPPSLFKQIKCEAWDYITHSNKV